MMNLLDIFQEWSKNPNKERDLFELIYLVSNRPSVFGCSSFLTVATFIEGYVYQKEDCSKELREFKEWLAAKLNFPTNWAWFSGIESVYPKDEDALRELPKLFEEFRTFFNKTPSI